MKTKQVNLNVLSAIFNPLYQMDDKEVMQIDPNNPDSVARLIEDVISPHFSEFGPKSRETVKNSFIYLFSSPQRAKLLEEIAPHHQIPMDEIQNVPAFFEKIWAGLFHEPLPTAENLTEFIVSNHDYEANLVKMR